MRVKISPFQSKKSPMMIIIKVKRYILIQTVLEGGYRFVLFVNDMLKMQAHVTGKQQN